MYIRLYSFIFMIDLPAFPSIPEWMTAYFREPRHPCTIPSYHLQCHTLIWINMPDLSTIWIGSRHRRCLTCLSKSIPVTRTIITPFVVTMLGTRTIFYSLHIVITDTFLLYILYYKFHLLDYWNFKLHNVKMMKCFVHLESYNINSTNVFLSHFITLHKTSPMLF